MAAFLMGSDEFDGVQVWSPKVLVTVKANGVWSRKFRGVIDTGAIPTLMSIHSSRLVGLSENEARQGLPAKVEGLDKATYPVYRWAFDLRLWSSDRWMELKQEPVYFCDAELPHEILIGQRDALGQRLFVQNTNASGQRYFVLRDI